ncbi:FtsX-like permease family protein [Streptomyces misionensis]|uniref:FtsX-like permease family protein n=1 Tax=Streptomyces misionensis TaxID=67331 RepID=A0A5C6J6H9_9ACTN|nr:FtsX-like permease family protein [Streptomyces misionensis]TWV36145.1 FtsX-like permease family protein [Streptomyces misionensis]
MSRPVRQVVAPWVRTRLRVAPGAAGALALLVALAACLAGAGPRAVDRYEDAGLRRAFAQARPDRTTVQVTAPQPDPGLPADRRAAALRPAALERQYASIRTAPGAPLAIDPAQSMYGVAARVNLPVPDPWLPRPSGLPAQVALFAPSGLAEHARVRTGRLPRADRPADAATAEVEAAVTAATADRLHIETGSVIHVPAPGRPPLRARVTGILLPRDPGGAYWSTVPLLRTPALMTVPTPGTDQPRYWLGGLLLPQGAAPALPGTGPDPVRYPFLPPDPGAPPAHDLGALKSAVAALESGPGLRRARAATGDDGTGVTTQLDDTLASFARLRSGIAPLVSLAGAGAATVVAVVLLMAGALAADRRRAELALLRARGAALPALAGRLLAETAVIAVPAGALGLLGALLAVPAGRTGYSVAAAGAVTLTACAALPLRAARAHRTVRSSVPRADLATERPSRRRTIAELTVLVLAAGAVEALRRRGPAGDGLVALAPVLIGVVAALVLLRLTPFLLRRLTAPAGRLRGAVVPLSLARASRTQASAVLPLLALLTALSTAAFGGSVLAGVATARDRAALLAVGADARVAFDAPPPATTTARVRAVPGVRSVAPVGIDYQAKPMDGQDSVPLIGVDPVSYGELADRTGLGAFPAVELRPSGGTLPAIASPSVAARYGTRHPFTVRLQDGSSATVRITVVRDDTPALPGGDFLVVDRAGLAAPADRPTALFLTGDGLSSSALRRAAGASATVQLRAVERARYATSPLQSGAEHVYTAAVATGAGFAVLALLLSLLRAAPERAALLARLRTMGLTRAEGRRLLILESLPQSALAAAAGALTGWATTRLLSPALDLTAVALPDTATVPARLRPDAWSLTVPALLLLATTTGIAVTQAWWTVRRGAGTELRAGDDR